jgi:NitT/TauT family transport system substrate-binding protein
MTMERLRPALLLGMVLPVLVLLAGCGRSSGPAPLTLALNWFPEAEHGGFYAALFEGYYAEEGLEVEILPGGPDAAVLARVATGTVDFGVENADQVVFGRAAGAPVRALMAPIQDSPQCIMVHEASGIERLADLRDVTLAMNPKGAFAQFLQAELPLAGVRIVPYTGTVTQFLLDPRAAQQAYLFSEPYIARQAGAEPRCLLISELGFNTYTSVLIASDRTWERDPELVRRFVRASIRGWEHYLADAAPTNARIAALNPEMDEASLAYGVGTLLPLSFTADTARNGFGTMTRERWDTLVSQMEALGVIPAGGVRAGDLWLPVAIPAQAE